MCIMVPKFCGNESNCYQNMVIFLIFKTAAVCHLENVMRIWNNNEQQLMALYCYAKFGWNQCSSFNNMQVLILSELGLKVLLHAPFRGFLGLWPLNGEQYQWDTQKALLAQKDTIWRTDHQNQSISVNCAHDNERNLTTWQTQTTNVVGLKSNFACRVILGGKSKFQVSLTS